MFFHSNLRIAITPNRSSRPEVFCKKGVLRNFRKFTGKHLCQSLFFNNVAGLRHRCFLVNFPKFLRTPLLTVHLWWLLLTKVLSLILIETTEAATEGVLSKRVLMKVLNIWVSLVSLEIFKFLSRLFGYVEKQLDKKAMVNFKIYDNKGLITNNFNTHISPISQ